MLKFQITSKGGGQECPPHTGKKQIPTRVLASLRTARNDKVVGRYPKSRFLVAALARNDKGLVEQCAHPFAKNAKWWGSGFLQGNKSTPTSKAADRNVRPTRAKSRFLRAFSLRCERLGMTRWLGVSQKQIPRRCERLGMTRWLVEQHPPFRKEREMVGQRLLQGKKSTPISKAADRNVCPTRAKADSYARSRFGRTARNDKVVGVVAEV